jgi:hypothetical protein
MADQRRFPPPWRAEPIPGGYVVRDANGQALAYLYSRDNPTEALQAKMLTKTRRAGSPSMSRGCRSCRVKRSARSSHAHVTLPRGRLTSPVFRPAA